MEKRCPDRLVTSYTLEMFRQACDVIRASQTFHLYLQSNVCKQGLGHHTHWRKDVQTDRWHHNKSFPDLDLSVPKPLHCRYTRFRLHLGEYRYYHIRPDTSPLFADHAHTSQFHLELKVEICKQGQFEILSILSWVFLELLLEEEESMKCRM